MPGLGTHPQQKLPSPSNPPFPFPSPPACTAALVSHQIRSAGASSIVPRVLADLGRFEGGPCPVATRLGSRIGYGSEFYAVCEINLVLPGATDFVVGDLFVVVFIFVNNVQHEPTDEFAAGQPDDVVFVCDALFIVLGLGLQFLPAVYAGVVRGGGLEDPVSVEEVAQEQYLRDVGDVVDVVSLALEEVVDFVVRILGLIVQLVAEDDGLDTELMAHQFHLFDHRSGFLSRRVGLQLGGPFPQGPLRLPLPLSHCFPAFELALLDGSNLSRFQLSPQDEGARKRVDRVRLELSLVAVDRHLVDE